MATESKVTTEGAHPFSTGLDVCLVHMSSSERVAGRSASATSARAPNGMAADVAACAAVCHAAGVPLVVDQAWGPHFGFHPGVPASALCRARRIRRRTSAARRASRTRVYVAFDALYRQLDVYTEAELRELHASVTDPNVRIFADADWIYTYIRIYTSACAD